MEFIMKLNKREMKDIIEAMLCKIECVDEELAEECESILTEHLYDLSLETAQEIVNGMVPCGEVYDYETVKEVLKKHNNYNETTEPRNSIDYYLAMNMSYNDYKPVLEKYSVANCNQFCYDLSKCFIEDEDGGKHKVSKYFLMLK